MPGTIFLEDFSPGDAREFGAYEVTEEEIIEFAGKYDPQPFHLDHDAAAKSIFGRLCASGWHTCAMTMRMMVDHMKEIGDGASLGSPGIDRVRWLKPVFPGDVLSVKSVVEDVRPSKSKPGIGVVRQSYTVSNQQGEPVMAFTGNAFFPRREAG